MTLFGMVPFVTTSGRHGEAAAGRLVLSHREELCTKPLKVAPDANSRKLLSLGPRNRGDRWLTRSLNGPDASHNWMEIFHPQY